MKLSELLAIQAELNQHCPTPPKSDENENVLWAIIEELGEVAKARQGEWKWWTKYGQPLQSESRDRQLEECADVLCFLLTRQLHEVPGLFDIGCDLIWERAWTEEIYVSLGFMLSVLVTNGIQGSHLTAYARFLNSLGYTREELEGAYMAKVQINKDRWAKVSEEKRQQAEAVLVARYGSITEGLGDN